MSSLNSLDHSRMQFGFHKINIIKPSHTGDLVPTEVEILDSHLSSETDELDIVVDKDKLPSKKPHKSGRFKLTPRCKSFNIKK